MADDLGMLVEQARSGNSEAFIDLVASTMRDLRVFAATYASSAGMVEAVLTATVAAVRSRLGECPADATTHNWLRRITAEILAARLDEADRAAVAGQDTLNHVVIQAGREALQANPTVDNSAGSKLGAGYGRLGEDGQRLIALRYGEGQTAGGIAQELQRGEDEITHGLCAARAQLDWTGAAGEIDSSDRLFPALVEDWLAGAIVPDSRALLVAGVMQDMERARRFERQVRLHLMLSAWYGPATRGDAQALVASLGAAPARHESSRMIMAQPSARSSGVHQRPPTATVRRGTSAGTASARTSSGSRRAATASRARSSGQHQASLDDDVDVPPPNRMPLIIAGVLVLIGAIGLATMMMRSGTVAQPVPRAQDSVAETPAGDSQTALALVHRAEGKTQVVQKGKQIPAESGVMVEPGDSLETVGEGSQLGLLALNQVRLTLKDDAAIGGMAVKDKTLSVMLTRGRVLVDVMDGAQVRAVSVVTAQGRADFPTDSGGVVHALGGGTRLDGLKGKPRLARANGGAGVEVVVGKSATVRDGGDAAIDQPARFVRGINVGGDAVTIDGKRWLSWQQALGAGLTVSAGVQPAPAAPVNSRGIDFDSKIMLDSGLISPVGALKLTQPVPNGEFDVSLWVAGEGTITGQGIELSLGGQSTPVGQSAFKGEGWRMLGPYRVAVKNGKLEISIGGLRNIRLAGVAMWAAGKLEGVLPPTVAIVAPESGRHTVRRELALTADAQSLGGEIAKVEFLDGETMIGQAVRQPWTVVWDRPTNGKHRIVARATDSGGATATSAAVEMEIEAGDGNGSIAVEQWFGVGGGSVDDLLRNANFPAKPSQRMEKENFSSGFNGEDHATRWRGWIVPPADGEYVFGLTSDDNGQLWLGTSEDQTSRVRIATVGSWTGFTEWEKFPEQTSRPIPMVAKRKYWIEALHKQGMGGSHLAVRWRLPDGTWEAPIPGIRLYPVPFNTPTLAPGAPIAATSPPAATPAPAAVPGAPVKLADTTPQLKGVFEKPAEFVNLSQEGSEDWIHYGMNDGKSVNRKAGDLPVLSAIRSIDNAEIKRYDNNSTKYSWGDGAPNASANNTNTGVFVEGSGKGLTFTAPADQTLRRLRIWLGAFECRGLLTATLSDASSPVFRDESAQIQKGSMIGVYTLTYRAKSAGQTLTVNFTPAVGTGNINFQAVALSLLEPRVVGFVKGVNLFGEPTTIDGNKWVGMKQAEADGLVIRNARKAGAVVEPKPAADAGMKAMLTTGAATKAGEELVIIQKIPNGRYDITFYLMETVVANARLFDLTVEDESLPNVGALPINTWAAYGPVSVTVRDGTLDISTKTRKGSPMLMGFSIATAAR